MKLWKKRWFVLSDMCLFYYRGDESCPPWYPPSYPPSHFFMSMVTSLSAVVDEKEDSILGSILLPSFHVSMLSVDDHISRKYAFKVRSSPFPWWLYSSLVDAETQTTCSTMFYWNNKTSFKTFSWELFLFFVFLCFLSLWQHFKVHLFLNPDVLF